MRKWQFRQKTGPFGLSKDFYLTVLSSVAQQPALIQVASPQGEGGAVEGYIAPLAPSDRDALLRPLQRGAYVVATKDRKTVLRLLVLSKEEAGFDPAPIGRSKLAAELPREVLDRISATWTLAQITVESHAPEPYESIRFILRIAQRLAWLGQGVVGDPLSETYKLPEEVFHNPQAGPLVDARDVVAVRSRPTQDTFSAFTLGFRKFGLPELEICLLRPEEVELAKRFLTVVSQKVLEGELLDAGDQVGERPVFFQAATGGFDRGHWEGIPVLELIPPAEQTTIQVLENWARKHTA